MRLLPVVTRELTVQARRRSTYWVRVLACAVAGFFTLCLLLVTAPTAPMAGQGKTLFSTLSIIGFVYCLPLGPLVTADCLSAEKREGTIGLLLLTDLKGYDIIFGKMLSSSIHAVYGLLALVPMMALTLPLGGVTGAEVARTALVLGNTLFFTLSAGVFVSAISTNERRAVFAALLLMLIVTAVPYEIGLHLMFNDPVGGRFSDLNQNILAPSPAFAFRMAQSPALGPVQSAMFYSSVAMTHGLSWVLLASACAIVPRVWKDRPKGRKLDYWSELSRSWRLGKPEERALYRRSLLDQNPVLWLCARERHKSKLVWVLILPFTVLALWGYAKYSLGSYELSLFLVFTVQVLVKVWLTGETCHRWIEDRRCSALELLACTPLQVGEMVRGQTMALRRQFAWPVIVILSLAVAAWIGIVLSLGRGSSSETGRIWLLMSLPVFVADLVALRWVGMWTAIRARGLNRAIAQTLVRVLWWRWLIYLFAVATVGLWGLTRVARHGVLSEPLVWLGLALTFDFILAWSARHQFLSYFRAIAANPSDWKSALHDSANVEKASDRRADILSASSSGVLPPEPRGKDAAPTVRLET